MSALRTPVNAGSFTSGSTPYPTWSAVAEMTGTCDMASKQDSQAMKEERIWRALADEPVSEIAEPASFSAPRSDGQRG